MWQVDNPEGDRRVVVTRGLPGDRWRYLLAAAGYRVDVWEPGRPPTDIEIQAAIGIRCDAVIGQLTERWSRKQLAALASAGGRVYSNYAVGYDNVDVEAATELGITVTNTPGVLTRTTAELAAALTLAAARRIVESDASVRAGRFAGWEPALFLGKMLYGKTLGVVGPGRIGRTYARMMIRGFDMNLVYHGPGRKPEFERALHAEAAAGESPGDAPFQCRYAADLADLLKNSDVVSLHPPLTAETHHLLNEQKLRAMKPDAVLINVSRGAVIDEQALVRHCREYPSFRVGLDVYENEPELTTGLAELPNVVVTPHIGSASRWTREAMSTLAARNVIGVLEGYPVWDRLDFEPLLVDGAPSVTPSIVSGPGRD